MSIDWQAFWLTLELAAVVSAILFALGLPIAYWIAFSRWRWKFLVEAALALPIVLPPTVLGFYVLLALGSRSPLGRCWQSLTGHTLAFTFAGLLLASVLSMAWLRDFGNKEFAPALVQAWRHERYWLMPIGPLLIAGFALLAPRLEPANVESLAS